MRIASSRKGNSVRDFSRLNVKLTEIVIGVVVVRLQFERLAELLPC